MVGEYTVEEYKQAIKDAELTEKFEDVWGCELRKHKISPPCEDRQKVMMRTLEESDEMFLTTVFICRGKAWYQIYKK